MSRHKLHPDMPSGLNKKERYAWFKANGICTRCLRYVDNAQNTLCDSCCANQREDKRERLRKRNQKVKHNNLEFCVEQATELHLSYGEYMSLKSKGRV